jgi:ABC-type sulfate transport system substrate-binding protein
MTTENQTQEVQKIKVQSSYIPSNWKKNQDNKAMGYLNWMAYTIQSKEYTNDQQLSDALLTFNK